MIEPEETDRWRNLAEELGLPPDKEETPSSCMKPAPSLLPSPLLVGEGKSERDEPAARAPAEPVVMIEPDEAIPAREEEQPARGRRRRHPPSSVGEEQTETGAEHPAEERPRRRRRRGGKRTASETDAAGEEIPDVESAELESEERPRRRRRRGRKVAEESKARPAVETEEEQDEEDLVQEPAREDEDEADEDAEDFSTWNVPSWADIIAGLYRPER